MPADQTTTPTLADHLPGTLRLGDPDVHGPLAVFPVFGPPAQLDYRSFAQGCAAGAGVRELPDGASVNDLLVVNPGDVPVLLYEGEEVLGAQQNRTFDTSVLVPAGARVQVPVSCMEAGRWDGTRHREAFSPSPQAAYPEMRRQKSRAVRERVAVGGAARAVQGAVWQEIDAKSARMSAPSATNAMHDIFQTRRGSLEEFRRAIPLHDGQTGALAAIGGRIVVLDHVSRPDVFAALHAPLVQGYALDALEAADTGAPCGEQARAFLDGILGAPVSERDGIGMGREVRFTTAAAGGAGLVAGPELIQLTAFAEDDPGTGAAGGPSRDGRIRRPSRRRSA